MFTNIRLNQTLKTDHLSDNLAAVRLAQPMPIAVQSEAVLVQAAKTVPVLQPNLTTRLEQVRWVNPELAAKIATIRPIAGVPRHQITVPICPQTDVTDEVLFDSPGQDKKFYLPRYRVAERNQQVQISLAATPQGWGLTIHLEKYPAAVIQEAARSAEEIAHSITVILQHRLVAGVASGGQKELIFQEVTAQPEGIRAVLQVPTIAERDLLYQVLTNPDYAAILTIRRSLKVGIPLSETATQSGAIVSSATGTIRGTWTFSFDSGTEGGNGDVWWQQETDRLRQMVPRGNAQIVSLGVRDFNAITVSDLQSLTYGSAAIDGSVIQWKKRFPTQTPPIFRHPDPRVQELSPKINPAVLKVRPDNLRNIRVNNFRPIQPIEIRPRDPIIRNEDNFDPTDNRRNLLVNGSVFAVKTNSGNFAKVQVLSYGYNLQVQWVTYHPKVEPQFREVVRVLDVVSDRSPFVFPPALHPHIFSSITGTTTPLEPVFTQINGHSYYQDAAERHVFYYLPDSFKLVRDTKSPHYPQLSVQFLPIADSEDVQVMVNYWAFPYVNAARLEAAAKELKGKIPEPLPAGVTGVVFQPLVANNARLFLGLPKPDGSLSYQECPEVLVELRSGFRDSRTLPLQGFQSIYDAIFTPNTQLFQGQVRVSLQNGRHTEIIPFIAQMNDMVGEKLDNTKTVDTATRSILATLKNTIESPILINRLNAKIANGNVIQVDGVISSLSAVLPARLNPGESLSFSVSPASEMALNPSSEVIFDLSGVEVLADSSAIWSKIVLPQSTMTYKRKVRINTLKATFGDRIEVISIDLKLGDTVNLLKDTPLTPEGIPTHVVTPIQDLILRKTDDGSFEYRSLVILNDGRKIEDPESQWRSEQSEMLWVTNSNLPPI